MREQTRTKELVEERIAMGSEGLEKEEVELELGLSLGGNYGNGVKVDRGIQGLEKQEEKRKREEKEINDSGRVKLGALTGNESGGKNHEEESGKIGKKSKVNEQGLIQNDMESKKQSMPLQYLYPYPYPYPNPQFQGGIVVPFGDGSLVPCWYEKEGKGVVNPVMSYGFVPFGNGLESGLGNGMEQNGSRKEEKKKPGSAESSIRSSSGKSDRKSSSCEGGGSNDSRSHSICSLPEQYNGSKSSISKNVSEHSATSNLSNSAPVNEATNQPDKLLSSNSSQPCLSGLKEATLRKEPSNTNKEILTPANQNLCSSMETKREASKPPKPHIQKQNTPPSFSYMPCVSTKGDGPDGKTINGFLHRYSKTEVSIICSCHGSIFSPAGFVEHAGGKDVSHPLRHITVMPPAF